MIGVKIIVNKMKVFVSSVVVVCSIVTPTTVFASSTQNPPSSFNQQEQQIFNSMPTDEQNVIMSVLTGKSKSLDISKLTNSEKALLESLYENSDLSQWMKNHQKIILNPNSEKTISFPDGSSITFGSKITANSSDSKPTIQELTNSSITSAIAKQSTLTPSYSGPYGSQYTSDNFAKFSQLGSELDSINYYVYYDSILFVDANGNPVGYGADIVKTYPDAATSSGLNPAGVCNPISDTTNQNDSQYANATSTYTVGSAGQTQTWQLETYWNSSVTNFQPLFYDQEPNPY